MATEAYELGFRMCLQEPNTPLKQTWMNGIVRVQEVDKRDALSLRKSETAVTDNRSALVSLYDETHTRVGAKAFDGVRRAIGGAVIHHNHLERLKGLRQHGFQALRHPPFHLIGRNDNGDGGWRGHLYRCFH